MKDTGNHRKNQAKITEIGITDEVLTGRGGMAPFVRYLTSCGVLTYISGVFGPVRARKNGLGLFEMFKQIICYFVDGSSRHLTWFDKLRTDQGYAASIETCMREMASSHAVKRFVGKISFSRTFSLRLTLQKMFIRRLNFARPAAIVLGMDTMVLDNDDAKCREGVEPTYKKVKGFQPLQMTWEGRIVDAVLRGGDKHSNHSDTAEKMIRHIAGKIRRGYRKDVPITIRMDSGFFDQKLFKLCEELGVYYICGGKQYADICEYISGFQKEEGRQYWKPGKEKEYWEYTEFMDRRESWKTERRCMYCRYVTTGQGVFEFARRDTVIYTNIGSDPGEGIAAEQIIEMYHQRGSDELVHRGLKEFHAEQLPFERFESNMFWYYMILISFFLLENYKEDVAGSLIPRSAFATTTRRTLIDFAAKIVRHAGKITLKVTRTTWELLDFPELWRRTGSPPLFA